ncbi:MAG: hypothetical protein KBT11_04080 [Treponema sp.]|nr:hypothetical protein [Candidatus Treponema equifaecale]
MSDSKLREKKSDEPAVDCRRISCEYYRCYARKTQPSQTTLCAAAILLVFALIFASCSKKAPAPETNFVIPENATEIPDIDLSKMNANMVYAQVFDMMIASESYAEKRIKMSGAFEIYPAADNGKKAYAIIISDALACCKTGIEFQYNFENQEPQPGTELTVTGTFKLTELQDGIQYFFIEAEKVEQ